MFLTRVELDLEKSKTKRGLVNPNMFHACIAKICDPMDRDSAERRYLWRVDDLNGKKYILVLTPEKPDMSPFIDEFGKAGTVAETKPYEKLLERTKNYTNWFFRLPANPSKYEKETKKRKALCDFDSQMDWLIRKGKQNGFMVIRSTVAIQPMDTIRFFKSDRTTLVQIPAVTYSGVLRITDETAFKTALTRGVGRGRGYGLGMLTVIKA